MDTVTPKLAGLRLASIQCASTGHPTTSGFPTIDHYLSSEPMEPAEEDDPSTARSRTWSPLKSATDTQSGFTLPVS